MEARIAANFPEFQFEPDRLKYTWPARTTTYNPDWKLNENLYFESKGILSVTDRKKMLLVKAQYPAKEFVFIFQNPQLFIGKRIGTCAQWATKHGFAWFDEKDTLGIKNFISER